MKIDSRITSSADDHLMENCWVVDRVSSLKLLWLSRFGKSYVLSTFNAYFAAFHG